MYLAISTYLVLLWLFYWTLSDFDFGLRLVYCLIFPYCSRRLLQPGAARECQDQASVSELGSGRNHDGHVVFFYHCGVLLWPELMPSVQPPSQDGWIRHINWISFSKLLFFQKILRCLPMSSYLFNLARIIRTWCVVFRSLKQPQKG